MTKKNPKKTKTNYCYQTLTFFFNNENYLVDTKSEDNIILTFQTLITELKFPLKQYPETY